MTGYEGLRVLRGPDWEGGDSDGGEGYLGTLVQLPGDHKVRVLWDMGQETTCNAGHDGKFELRVFDTAQAGQCACVRACVRACVCVCVCLLLFCSPSLFFSCIFFFFLVCISSVRKLR